MEQEKPDVEEIMECSVCGGMSSSFETDKAIRALKRFVGGLRGIKWQKMDDIMSKRRCAKMSCRRPRLIVASGREQLDCST